MAGGDYEELDATPVRRRVVTFLGLSGLVVTAVAAVTVPSSPFALGKSLSALEAVAVTKEFKQTLDPATFAKLKSVTYGTLDTRDQKSLFDQFIDEYSKSYDTTHEYNDRFTIFSKNLNYIDALNTQNPHALFGLNVFADQTEEERSKRRMTDPSITNYTRVKQELKKMMNPTVFEAAEAGAFADGSYKSKMRRLQDAPDSSKRTTDYELSQGEVGWASGSDCAACNLYPAFGEYDMGNLPDDFDWRELGAVTRVKNQAYCGSCWSFSTAADLEGTHYLATGDLESYAPQQLVECNTMNLGCDGGYPFAAMQYLSHFGGMVTWETMPYKKIVYGDAAWNPTGTPSCDKELLNEKLEDGDVAHISGWQMVAMGADYESLMRVTLVKNGPLSIAFNANGMDYYVHGVHTDGNGKVPYWVIKNSWDDVWGEDGYDRLVRGSNACGVANMVVHSIVKSTTDDDSR
ncbi:C1 peptidase-like protein [Aureococcus anophagefferens]|nr:C1 peptidase-like protein [Aureococcus anophagefferens]